MHIDAGHEYGSCREDVLVWWPLLRHSGILMGDDYSPNSFPGVVKAAKEFVLQCELDKFFSLDGNKWIVRKPSADWFAEHPDLPPFCTQGDTSHMVGVVKGN
ncbi:methyltransferase [Micractinium conductrix]|uniref:Methyltransferase n=1 Tax=Micractinium conductrix TaxID=554055 RepID=A0A2P6V8Z0_9CHLO|nr:methyltransferase [Micractinium conductrix]|eukprot:PSC70557.1 methyltransferase [Micractinium conductrix]